MKANNQRLWVQGYQEYVLSELSVIIYVTASTESTISGTSAAFVSAARSVRVPTALVSSLPSV